jgi:hypothetical protein
MFRQLTTGIIVAAILSIFWVGCSDDTTEIITSGGSTGLTVTGVSEYFPLTQGYSTMYEVVGEGTSEVVTYTVGIEVAFSGGTAREWISYRPSVGYDTGYFQATSRALYYFSTLTSDPEKILQLPLTAGQTWVRSDYSASTDDSVVTIFDKFYVYPDTNQVINPKDDDYGGGYFKNYPTAGQLSMSVEKVEQVRLANGALYTGSVKILNQNINNTYNIYWFAPGIGLVKYVMGAATSTGTAGIEIGELRSWGY